MGDAICPNQTYGRHIVVRCKGCGSRHSTKNIGQRNLETNEVYCARHIFDIYGERCKCQDPQKFPLVHDCAVDDIQFIWDAKNFEPLDRRCRCSVRCAVGRYQKVLLTAVV